MVQEVKAFSFPILIDQAKEGILKREVDELISQVIEQPTREDRIVVEVSEDWRSYMPTVAELNPHIERPSIVSINHHIINIINSHELYSFNIDGLAANLKYSRGRTSFERPVEEGNRFKIKKNKISDDLIGEEVRLRMIKEILEFALTQKKLDQLGQ